MLNRLHIIPLTGIVLITACSEPIPPPPPPEPEPLRNKIVFSSTRDTPPSVYVMDLDGGNPTPLNTGPVAASAQPSVSPDGLLVAFFKANDIWTITADGTVQTNLTQSPSVPQGSPDWSPDGSQIAFTAIVGGNQDVYTMWSDGTRLRRITTHAGQDRNPRWSPDGSLLAFTSDRDGNLEVYTITTDGTNPTNLTNDSSADVSPSWSPDGSRLSFASGRGGIGNRLWTMASDGSTPQIVVDTVTSVGTSDWNNTGSSIVFSGRGPSGTADIFIVGADGTGVKNLTSISHSETWPRFSP